MKLAIALAMLAAPATAEPVRLLTYLESMNYAAVELDGDAGFTGDRDREFIFRSANGDYFELRMDSGRSDREKLMANCKVNAFFIEPRDLCEFHAKGTVEIDGSRIVISVEDVSEISANK